MVGPNPIKRWSGWVLAGIVLFFAYVWPMVRLSEKLTFYFWTTLFSRASLFVAVQTFAYTLLALILMLLVALPLAFVLKNRRGQIPAFIRLVFQITWVLPTFTFAFLVLWFLKTIHVVEIYSMNSVLLAWWFAGTPFLTLGILSTLEDLDTREIEAMQTLGANAFQRLRLYYLPKISHALFSVTFHEAWILLTSFSLVVLLGGGPPRETLEVAVYTSVRMDRVDYNQALAFVVWQMFLLFLLKFVFSFFHANEKQAVGFEWKKNLGNESSILRKIIFLSVSVGIAYLLLQNPDLRNPTLSAVLLAVWVSVSTLFFSGVFYILQIRWLSEWSAWTSPMILALIWWRAYSFSVTPLFLCVAVQTVLFIPWVSRVLYPLLDRKRVLEIEAIRTLGAKPLRAWLEIEWTRIHKEVKRMVSWIFGLSIIEVSTVILFSKGDFEPLSVWTQNQFSRFHLDEASQGTYLLLFLSVLAITVPQFSFLNDFFKGKNGLRRN